MYEIYSYICVLFLGRQKCHTKYFTASAVVYVLEVDIQKKDCQNRI